MNNLIEELSNLRCQFNCFDENERDAYHTLSKAIKVLSAQSEPQWILCNERLPEEDEQVFVYLFDASPYIAWFCDGRWHTEEFMLDEDEEPAAWMPLPEPYSEEGGQA